MTEYKVSSRYAHALLDVARQTNSEKETLADVEFLQKTLAANPDLQVMLSSPVINTYKKKRVLTESFKDRISELTLNFIVLLTDKGRESLLRSVLYEFIAQYRVENNILPVTITTAREISGEAQANIISKLSQSFGKTILPSYKIDPGIIGGTKIQVDDWMFDASLAGKLDALRERLTEGV
ncbi:MAG: ATP synthase F1 subunit delta [Chloroflexota bacterium]